MQQVNRRSFLAGLLAGGTAVAAGGEIAYVAAKPVCAPPAPKAIPTKGVLVIEFDAARFRRGRDGDYYGVVQAVVGICNGREIFQVGSQCMFPVYAANGSPSPLVNIILIPKDYQADGGHFGDAPKVRWLGGDRFEAIA